mgnify:CR=1 FL=1
MTARTPLQQLGWDDHFQQAFDAVAQPGHFPARVITEQRGQYRLVGAEGPLRAFPPVRMRRKTDSLEKPGVGDWVAVAPALSLIHI